MTEKVKNKSGLLDKIFKILFNIVIFFVCVIAFILVVYVFSAQIHKNNKEYKPFLSFYTIVSPSMNPVIKVYDVVVNTKVSNPEDIEVGDIITYISTNSTSEGMTITHRVVAISKADNGSFEYQTQGDNNSEPEGVLVTFDNVIGKEIMIIPKLGRIQFLLANKKGWFVLLLIPILLFVFKDIYDLVELFGLKKKVDDVSGYLDEPVYVTKNKVKDIIETQQKEILKRELSIHSVRPDAMVRNETEGEGFLEPYTENVIEVGKPITIKKKEVPEVEPMKIIKADIIEENETIPDIENIKVEEKEVKPIVDKVKVEEQPVKLDKVEEKEIPSTIDNVKEEKAIKLEKVEEKEVKPIVDNNKVEEKPVKLEMVEEKEIIPTIDNVREKEKPAKLDKIETKEVTPTTDNVKAEEKPVKVDKVEKKEIIPNNKVAKVNEKTVKVNKIEGKEIVPNTDNVKVNEKIKSIEPVLSPIEILDTDELTSKIKDYDQKIAKLNEMLMDLEEMRVNKEKEIVVEKEKMNEEIAKEKEEARKQIEIEKTTAREEIENMKKTAIEEVEKKEVKKDPKKIVDNYLIGRKIKVINSVDTKKKRIKKADEENKIVLGKKNENINTRLVIEKPKSEDLPKIREIEKEEKVVKEEKKKPVAIIDNRELKLKNNSVSKKRKKLSSSDVVLKELNTLNKKSDSDLLFNPKMVKKVETNKNDTNVTEKEKKKGFIYLVKEKNDKK